MSILGALKQMKQQTGSLDELASLPHVMIMQMARTGQIPKEQVLPILSRKKELADDSANDQAMRQPTQQATLLEKILAAEQPQQMADMGVAQLPIRDDMYDEQRMAGGGIVAFRNNEDQPVDENMPTTDETNPYLRRSQGVYEAGRQLFNPRNYNPFAKAGDLYQAYQQNIGQPFAGAVNRFVNEPVGQQADRFRQASEARQNIGKRMAGVPTTSEEARRLAPAEKIVGNEQALYDAERLAKESGRTSMPTIGGSGQIIAPEEGTKKQKIAAAGANAAAQETGASPVSPYEQILIKQGEDATKARQEAKYMRLLEAGLGIMGGTSPYAFTNIGQGATAAAKGYAEDIKGFRAEERERAKTLGALGMEKEKIAADREKTAMLERRYAELAKLEKEKIGAMYGGRADEKFVNQVNQIYRADISALKNQLGRELTDDELNSIYTNAYNRVGSVSGRGPASTGTSNKGIGFSDFMSKK
jgi:hypothetical protein